jgi:hypothetical protein
MAGDEFFTPRHGGDSCHALRSAPGRRAGSVSPARPMLSAEKGSVASGGNGGARLVGRRASHRGSLPLGGCRLLRVLP